MTEEEVRSLAFDLLGRRPWTAQALRDRLVRRGATPQRAAAVVARLVELGYLDDAEFARQWVESRTRLRPTGAGRLRRELARQGVPDDAAAAAVAGIDPRRFQEQADRLARERLDRLSAAGAEPREAVRKVAAFLARRGFDWDTIRAALRHAGREA